MQMYNTRTTWTTFKYALHVQNENIYVQHSALQIWLIILRCRLSIGFLLVKLYKWQPIMCGSFSIM